MYTSNLPKFVFALILVGLIGRPASANVITIPPSFDPDLKIRVVRSRGEVTSINGRNVLVVTIWFAIFRDGKPVQKLEPAYTIKVWEDRKLVANCKFSHANEIPEMQIADDVCPNELFVITYQSTLQEKRGFETQYKLCYDNIPLEDYVATLVPCQPPPIHGYAAFYRLHPLVYSSFFILLLLSSLVGFGRSTMRNDPATPEEY